MTKKIKESLTPQQQWVKAVLEHKFATAAYIYDCLDEINLEDYMIAPWIDRESFHVKGEINN